MTALSEFLKSQAECDALATHLRNIISNNFDTHPDEITYADVGTVKKVASDLQEILKFLGV